VLSFTAAAPPDERYTLNAASGGSDRMRRQVKLRAAAFSRRDDETAIRRVASGWVGAAAKPADREAGRVSCFERDEMPFAAVRPDILYAWRGPSLLITDLRGDCGPAHQLSGFYFREARHLETLALEINGRRPWLCEAASVDSTSLALTFVYPEITEPGGGGTGQAGDEEGIDRDGIPERSLDIRLSYRVNVSSLEIDLEIANRARQPVTFELAWKLDADFADIQEAQAGRRQQEAPVSITTAPDHVSLVYAHPELPFHTEVHHEGHATFEGGRLLTRLTLAPQQQHRQIVRVISSQFGHSFDPEAASDRERVASRWRERFARVEVPGNRAFEEVITRNIRDVASFPLLDGEPDEWLALQAGVPLYPAFFGRDAVTAGWQAGFVDSGEALDAALTKLGRLQSGRFDDWRDEQPGRIPYQIRTGPLAILNLNPYSAYYADYASPLMFVISLANLWAWTGDRRRVERHWDTARRILDWASTYGDMDRDGYLEYQTRSSKGTKNQGWKDSGDAIVYDDGTPVPAPIATCELQGYWFAAQELAALLSSIMGSPGDAAAYRESAAALKQRFNRDWWVEHEQFVALALDPDKRQVPAVTSNVGHCLACGIIDRDHLPAVVGRMFAPDLFSGWGIRTLSTSHALYNPLSYHRGTVWAVEQATIVFGLRRFGFDARALELSRALFDLSLLYADYRIPECVGGYARGERPVPGAYPRANAPQLWNATAFALVVQTLLGLLPIAASNTLILDPVLPSWMPELLIRDMRVGDAKVTLRFWLDEERTKWDVLHRQGSLHVLRQPAPESLTATALERAAGVVESMLE
jgi:glycogen debranching enzyme